MTHPDRELGRLRQFPQRTDVLVVGAGPTGLSLACGLAKRGIDHVVIDHAPQVATSAHSAVVDARTLEALESIEASAPLLHRGVTVTQFVLRDRDDQLFAADFTGLPTRHPYMLMVPESSAESVLSDRLASYGSSVFRPVTAVALEQSADEVTVALWDGCTLPETPSRRSIVARYVVGCDGMHSQIRSALGIPFVSSSRAESFVMADVRMRWSLPRSEAHLFFSEDGILVVAPLPDDRYRVLASVDRAIDCPQFGEVERLLATRGPKESPARVKDVIWSTGVSVNHRLATHYRSGRVFLAGDAAHVHSPAGGQGMNSGIQDALQLADMLADVLAGSAKESVLNAYEAERRPVANKVIRITRRLRGLATMRGRLGPKLRNRALRFFSQVPSFVQHFAGQIAGIDRPRRQPQGQIAENRTVYLATLVLLALLVLFASTR